MSPDVLEFDFQQFHEPTKRRESHSQTSALIVMIQRSSGWAKFVVQPSEPVVNQFEIKSIQHVLKKYQHCQFYDVECFRFNYDSTSRRCDYNYPRSPRLTLTPVGRPCSPATPDIHPRAVLAVEITAAASDLDGRICVMGESD